MKTLRVSLLGLVVVALLAGCGGSIDQESQPTLEDAAGDEAIGSAENALSVSKTLLFEGTCAWLKCTNHNSAIGACGYGCTDSGGRLARDYRWRWGCGKSVKVVRGTRTAWAKVWDQSCCGKMEGNHGLLSALAISHGSPTCGSYGWGSATATFYW